jgi:diadenosine tetraphosphate (Ap4A) HIT family hydrolase
MTGHTLIVPRAHGERLDNLSPEDAAAVMKAAQRIAKAILKLEGVVGYNLLQNNGRFQFVEQDKSLSESFVQVGLQVKL